MSWFTLGAGGLTAAATLLGGKMSSDASAKAARLNAIHEANMAEVEFQRNKQLTDEAQARDERLQKEFAQTGIQWKIQDARNAGIHPLAALGAQTASFTNNVGQATYRAPRSAPYSSASMGSAVAAAGQDISRAINTTRTEQQRLDAYNKTVQDLSLQRMGLENQLLSSQIAKINQVGNPPSFPSSASRLLDGQGNSPLVKDEAQKRVNASPSHPEQEPAPITDTGFTRTPKGYFPVMSKDAKERLEEDLPGVLLWNIRNRLLGSGRAPGEDPGPGREWYWHPLHFEYRNRKKQDWSQHGVPAFNPNW